MSNEKKHQMMLDQIAELGLRLAIILAGYLLAGISFFVFTALFSFLGLLSGEASQLAGFLLACIASSAVGNIATGFSHGLGKIKWYWASLILTPGAVLTIFLFAQTGFAASFYILAGPVCIFSFGLGHWLSTLLERRKASDNRAF